MIKDVAIVSKPDGSLTVHQASCPEARQAAADGLPVFTMFDIQRPVPRTWPYHACMKENDDATHQDHRDV